MKHLLTSLYSAAKISGLLPLTGSEYKDLGIPKSWQVSSCRIFVPANNSTGISSVGIYRQFEADLRADHHDAQIEPIKHDTGHGTVTIGASVTLRRDAVKAPRLIVWRNETANLALGTAVADIDLDRPNEKIARIRPLPMAERYVVGNGRGVIRELSEQEIKAATDATRKAQSIASGASLQATMRTVAAAPARLELEAPVEPAKPVSSEKKRDLVKAMIATPGVRQPDGSLLVSPLEWQDDKAAEVFGIDAADIAAMRQELGIKIQNVTSAIDAASARLDSLVNTKISAYGETEHHEQERLAARNLLALMKLGTFVRVK